MRQAAHERGGSEAGAVASAEGRCLIVRPKFGAARRFALGDRLVTIGRAQNADLVLVDPIVSSVHARIEPLSGGGHRIVDCHSRNGTRCNDLALSEKDLGLEDRIQIGGTLLVYARASTPLETEEEVSAAADAEPGRSSLLGMLVDDDTSTISVAPDEFDIDFLEPKTAIVGRTAEGETERRLAALYRAAKTLTPLSDREPVIPRFVKLVQDVLGTPRAALIRVGPADTPVPDGPPPTYPFEVVAAEVRAPGEPFETSPPVMAVLREARRTSRALLYGRRAPGTPDGERVGSAIGVPIAEDGKDLLVAYADVPAGWIALVPDDLRILGILGRHAAACVANQLLHDALARSNRDLEARVAERTRALAESERRLRLQADVVTHAAEAIFTIDVGGKVTTWNRAAEGIFGRAAAETIGRPALEAIGGEEERAALSELFATARRGTSPLLVERAFRTRDGARIDGQATFAPIVVEGADAPREVSVIIRDLTRSKRLEQEVLQTAKLAAVGTLAAGTAHEINNVLAVIMGNAELLQQSPGLGADDQESLTTILDAASRSRDIVRHLLTFARRRGPRREPVDLVELVEASLRLLSTELARAGARVKRTLAAIPPVSCDPGQISLAILNLVKNARDALAQKGGGELTVGLTRRPPETAGALAHAVLEVRDTGPGMPPEVRKRVFEPFFTTKEVGVGTGLGLSTAYGIVMNHGGKIEFESAPGEGSTFRILLPLERSEVVEVPAAEAAGVGAEDVRMPPRPTLHVLVCDDDAGIRTTLGAMVRRLSHEATAVSNGDEAVQAIRAARFDLVFLDLSMAGMDGLETRAQILKQVPEQRIVLVTGSSELEDLMQRTGLTADQILRKPFSYKDIALQLSRLAGA